MFDFDDMLEVFSILLRWEARSSWLAPMAFDDAADFFWVATDETSR
ncbi:hypothetical protein H3V53_13845 [Paraburkholderia bengalensis]|uniref:Uncharacterized protein n=1 Tax=Paraburkholderia bengalensis TaxID=2747562 RepID=A0ABU8IRJ9_9BURK